jgi:acyl-CoA dehydrogenase
MIAEAGSMSGVSAEALEIRALAREFAERELRPHAEAWDAAREVPAEVFAALGEMGFLGVRAPEEHGGLDLDLPTALLAVEALAWGESAVGLSVAIHAGPVTRTLRRFGTPEQQARWLPLLATGEGLGAFALSETDAGSDVGAVAARGKRDGGEWVLSGEKRWVTNGDRAGLVLLFARTGGEPGEVSGLSAFLLPGDAEGVAVTHRERTMGMCSASTVTLSLDGVRIPADALLGTEGAGWEVARDAIVHGRLFIAAQALGIAQAAQEHALRYAREREQFGRPLGGFGGVQEKLAGMAIRIAGARALLLDTAARVDRAGGELRGGEAEAGALHAPRSLEAAAAMAKIAATEAAMWTSDEAVQIFGGYGYMRDYPVEKLMRDAKGTEIYEGSNEVLRWVVARDLIREEAGG